MGVSCFFLRCPSSFYSLFIFLFILFFPFIQVGTQVLLMFISVRFSCITKPFYNQKTFQAHSNSLCLDYHYHLFNRSGQFLFPLPTASFVSVFRVRFALITCAHKKLQDFKFIQVDWNCSMEFFLCLLCHRLIHSSMKWLIFIVAFYRTIAFIIHTWAIFFLFR